MNNTDEDKKTLGERLKMAREMAGLSQAQVANLLNLHRPSISEIEAGRRKVSAEELSEFAKIYSIDISWLLASKDDSSEDVRVRFAARQLSKLKQEDLDKVIDLLSALRPKKG